MPKRASAAKPPRSLGPSDTPHQKKQQIPRRASNKAHLQPPRFKRILVALDGSPSSKYALDWATLLAEKLGAKLALVSVAPRFDLGLELVASPRNWQMIEAAFSEGEDRAKDVLEEAEVILRRKKLEATTTLLRGEPGQRIVEMARTSEADLVVLGSHGHGLAERFQLGSVGGTVKHTVSCSVLIARASPDNHGMLLAIDGSDLSLVAMEAGLQLSSALGLEPTVARVIETSSYGLARAAKAIANAVRGKSTTTIQPPEIGELTVTLGQGPPADTLRKMAAKASAQLIVVGSRGRGGLRSLALGSVSDQLTKKAKQSVLVIKPKGG